MIHKSGLPVGSPCSSRSSITIAQSGLYSPIGVGTMNQAGADGGAYLRSLSERVVAVEPPAHDLTAYWQAGGNVRAWVAALVAEHMERLLSVLDELRHAELFVRWLEIYEQALAATLPQDTTTFRLFS